VKNPVSFMYVDGHRKGKFSGMKLSIEQYWRTHAREVTMDFVTLAGLLNCVCSVFLANG